MRKLLHGGTPGGQPGDRIVGTVFCTTSATWARFYAAVWGEQTLAAGDVYEVEAIDTAALHPAVAVDRGWVTAAVRIVAVIERDAQMPTAQHEALAALALPRLRGGGAPLAAEWAEILIPAHTHAHNTTPTVDDGPGNGPESRFGGPRGCR